MSSSRCSHGVGCCFVGDVAFWREMICGLCLAGFATYARATTRGRLARYNRYQRVNAILRGLFVPLPTFVRLLCGVRCLALDFTNFS